MEARGAEAAVASVTAMGVVERDTVKVTVAKVLEAKEGALLAMAQVALETEAAVKAAMAMVMVAA